MKAWPTAGRLSLTALLLSGCAEGFEGFNEGGQLNTPDLNDGEPDTDEEGPHPSAPRVLDVVANFDDYPQIGVVLVIEVGFADAEGDLLGGDIDVAITAASTGSTTNLSYAIDDSEARVSGDQVVVVLQGVDEGEDYTLEVVLIDAAGHASEPMGGST